MGASSPAKLSLAFSQRELNGEVLLAEVGALRRHSPANFRNFQRITSWLALSGVLWIAGGLAHGETRFALWIIATARASIAGSGSGRAICQTRFTNISAG